MLWDQRVVTTDREGMVHQSWSSTFSIRHTHTKSTQIQINWKMIPIGHANNQTCVIVLVTVLIQKSRHWGWTMIWVLAILALAHLFLAMSMSFQDVIKKLLLQVWMMAKTTKIRAKFKLKSSINVSSLFKIQCLLLKLLQTKTEVQGQTKKFTNTHTQATQTHTHAR